MAWHNNAIFEIRSPDGRSVGLTTRCTGAAGSVQCEVKVVHRRPVNVGVRRQSRRMESNAAIPEDRPLTEAETSLVRWLLQQGIPQAKNYLPQLDRARVASRCY